MCCSVRPFAGAGGAALVRRSFCFGSHELAWFFAARVFCAAPECERCLQAAEQRICSSDRVRGTSHDQRNPSRGVSEETTPVKEGQAEEELDKGQEETINSFRTRSVTAD